MVAKKKKSLKNELNLDELLPFPRANSILVGQDGAEEEFVSAWNSGRCAHAWMISGAKGIGKATLAYRIARFVLSDGGDVAGKDEGVAVVSADGGLFGDELPVAPVENGIEKGGDSFSSVSPLQMGDDSPFFKRIASGGHADLTVIEKTYNEKTKKMRTGIVVDGVRNLSSTFYMTSSEGGWKVAIVDSADDMNTSSANALLKLLEEPPERSLIILLAHNPGRLLPTIKSRCRRLVLKPLPNSNVEFLLDKYLNHLEGEPVQLSGDDIKTLAFLADGSIGRAIELYKNGGLKLYTDMLGILGNGRAIADAAKINSFADTIAKSEESFDTFFDLLLSYMSKQIIKSPKQDGFEISQCHYLNSRIDVWEGIKAIFENTKKVNMDKKQSVMDALFLLGN
ncbi:MAG: DNA polymerase III subunit delta' [Alphaproteobacteria bacterium]|nr:DNA polymerase III subunit delta' [Alphaproteobacteria bacterium]